MGTSEGNSAGGCGRTRAESDAHRRSRPPASVTRPSVPCPVSQGVSGTYILPINSTSRMAPLCRYSTSMDSGCASNVSKTCFPASGHMHWSIGAARSIGRPLEELHVSIGRASEAQVSLHFCFIVAKFCVISTQFQINSS